MAEVKIRIGVDGELTVGVTENIGSECRDLTANIERALGTVTEDKITGDACRVETRNEAASNRA